MSYGGHEQTWVTHALEPQADHDRNMNAEHSTRTIVEQVLAYTPQSTNAWWCPWFVVLCLGCFVAIIAGILAGTIFGLVYCIVGIGVLCWQVGQRQARPPTCR